MIGELLTNPIETIVFLLLAMPGRLIAISCHEWGHAWMANKCGDPTARLMGRMTINPLAHLDPFGFLMMLIAGFGWAKPVPVNPRNFRKYRRDDLLVSLAGIAMNLILFCVGCIVMYAIVGMALYKASLNTFMDAYYITDYLGRQVFVIGGSYIPMSDLLVYAPYLSEFLIGGVFGDITMYAYQMLMYFTLTNLVLAIFNLIPVPPLDGFHVLDDTILHRTRFRMTYRAQQTLSAVLILLIVTGMTGEIIGFFQEITFNAVGRLANIVFTGIGLI